jgi:hypothetical protein
MRLHVIVEQDEQGTCVLTPTYVLIGLLDYR